MRPSGPLKREAHAMTVEGSLRFENVVKTFGGTRALKGVSLRGSPR